MKSLLYKDFAAETFSFCEEKNAFISPSSSIGRYFLWEGFLTNFLEDVTADSLPTFRFLTTAIKLLQIHLSSCPPLSSEPLIFTLCCPPQAGICARSHGEIWHSCIRRIMGMLETSYNHFFIGKKRWGESSWKNIINVQDQYQFTSFSFYWLNCIKASCWRCRIYIHT